MPRLFAHLLPALPACLLLATGCTNDIHNGVRSGAAPDAGTDKADDFGQIARTAFEADVAPLLDGYCKACHAAEEPVGFLKPDPDLYTAVTTSGLVDVRSPASSRLLTKGKHDGPAWTEDQAAIIESWIELEAQAAGDQPDPERETAAFTPVEGENIVDLAPIDLPGSTLTFRLEKLGVGAYLSNVAINAGPGGVHVVHPLFVPWSEGTPLPDPVDRFSSIDMTVEDGGSALLGGGTLVLVGVPDEFELSVHFAVAEAANGGPGGLVGGCNNVAAFTANAREPLAQNCVSCHGGTDPAATNATDMRLIGDLSPQGQEAACGQILSRVNLSDPANSGIFIAPDPASGSGHPFKFASAAQNAAFRTALLAWIAQE